MKKELTQKDFAFVKWTSVQMKKLADDTLAHKKSVYEQVKSILPEERTFENTVLALDMSEGSYENTFSRINILGEVSPHKEVRDAVHQILTDASEKMVDLEFDRDLYVSMLEYVEGNYEKEKKKLRKEDIKLLEESVREYKRAGFDKDEKTRNEIKKLLKKLSKLSQAFSKNLNDYTDFILCTKEELAGMNERYVASLPVNEKGKYMVTLAYPHIVPFLEQAENRKKRKELSEKNLSKGGKKNLKLIDEIVKLRADLAKLLGYKHHGDYRTETRMAKTAATVTKLQDSLLKKMAPLVKTDMKTLNLHAKELGIDKLGFEDIAYVSNSLKKKLYSLDPEEVKAYFPLPHVMKELFTLFESLFGITLTETAIKLWHKDVLLYEIRNTSEKGGDLVGYIALDLYPREGKYGHYAMFDVAHTHETLYRGEEMVAPFATVIGNFPAPQKKGKELIPSLIPISEVETLFHEFGHSLHHTLSESKLSSFAGTNVAWDFVETPSQFMENFVWNKEMLKRLSKHYKTGESLPEEKIDAILGSKKFNTAYFFARQMIHGKIDMDMHTGKLSTSPAKAFIDMNKKYFGFDLPEDKVLFPAGFGHMVGYDAGYYSYLWALVYAQDAFSLFEKAMMKDLKKEKTLFGAETKKIGMKWRKEVLAKGSSEEEMELLKKFLGREPSDEAFLKEIGV